MEIMNGAPRYWSILIDTSRIHTIADLQYHIKYHEARLVCNPETQTHDLEKRIKALESRSHQRAERIRGFTKPDQRTLASSNQRRRPVT